MKQAARVTRRIDKAMLISFAGAESQLVLKKRNLNGQDALT